MTFVELYATYLFKLSTDVSSDFGISKGKLQTENDDDDDDDDDRDEDEVEDDEILIMKTDGMCE